MSCEPCPALLPAINDLETMRALVCVCGSPARLGEHLRVLGMQSPPHQLNLGGSPCRGSSALGPHGGGCCQGPYASLWVLSQHGTVHAMVLILVALR